MATSAGYTATATGTDYWVATYNGDSNNSAVDQRPADGAGDHHAGGSLTINMTVSSRPAPQSAVGRGQGDGHRRLQPRPGP